MCGDVFLNFFSSFRFQLKRVAGRRRSTWTLWRKSKSTLFFFMFFLDMKKNVKMNILNKVSYAFIYMQSNKKQQIHLIISCKLFMSGYLFTAVNKCQINCKFRKLMLVKYATSLFMCRSLISGWRPAPTRTTSCAGKWRLWSAPTSRNTKLLLYSSLHPQSISSPAQTEEETFKLIVYELLVSSHLKEISCLSSDLNVLKRVEFVLTCFPGLKTYVKRKTKNKTIVVLSQLNFFLKSNYLISIFLYFYNQRFPYKVMV